ncbi:hypothetical protein [Roseovarius sp. 2305UL8-3]|uniref:hypothetical protein n=1 Tax=Roseovarius conchicola TaxID=3121636 RepID=UPI003528EEC6
MQIEAFPFPFYPLESPLHALVVIGVSVVFWLVGKGNRLIGSNPDFVRWDARNHSFFWFFAKRSASVAEQRIWLPDWHFRMYACGGLLLQWIGCVLGSFGLACLVISLIQNF